MQAISRRKFVTTAGVLGAGVAALGYHSTRKAANSRGMIRLLPVEGVHYSESFIRFMKRAKFDSVRDALASIRDRSIQVQVAYVKQTILAGPFEKVDTDGRVDGLQNRRAGNSRTAEIFPTLPPGEESFESSRPASS